MYMCVFRLSVVFLVWIFSMFEQTNWLIPSLAFCGGSNSFEHQLGLAEDWGHADPNIFCPSWPPAAILEVPVVMSPLGGMLCVLQNYSQHRLDVCDLERHVCSRRTTTRTQCVRQEHNQRLAGFVYCADTENNKINCSKKNIPWTHSRHTLLESLRTHLRNIKNHPQGTHGHRGIDYCCPDTSKEYRLCTTPCCRFSSLTYALLNLGRATDSWVLGRARAQGRGRGR